MTAAADEPDRRSEDQEAVVSAEEELPSRGYTAYNGQDVDLRTPAWRQISGR
ncbi:hypothetical protein ACFXKC_25955 [Streptomyces sp. NPDC059340]|uniref:hypothetical protein n=1 Tax=Streptomyces sp. NPDC059340 TaxID=3346806 RepID=UPI0036911488